MTNVPLELRQAARGALQRAVARGVVVKPNVCSGCGRTCESRELDGHHHNGYDEVHWLDVEWLCKRCHGLVHGHAPQITVEQRRQATVTRLERYGPDERRETYLHSTTPEERTARARRVMSQLNEGRTPAERSTLARRAALSGTSEERRERGKRARAAVRDTVRSCPTCNMISNPGGIATHRKAKSH